MNQALIALAALPLLAGPAFGSAGLNDMQLDSVAAGASLPTLPGIDCSSGGCNESSSSSSNVNGVITSINTSGPLGGGGSTGGGSTGGGSTGGGSTGGGSTGGGSTGGGSTGGPTNTGLAGQTVPIPATDAALLASIYGPVITTSTH